MKKIVLLLLLTPLFDGVAQVRLSKYFGDNMVLQRDQPIAVWGWANANEVVIVQFKNQKKNARAGSDGKWSLQLEPSTAGGPFQLVAKGKNIVVVNNILVGDVWVCSGQSNMEFEVGASNDAAKEVQQGNYPTIRHFKIPNTVASLPQDDLSGGEWKVCTPQNVSDFTAVGYFFARELSRTIKVPIGLVNATWGGTDIETWMSRNAFESSEEFKTVIASMPKLNLDSLAKQKSENTRVRVEKLQGSLPAASETQSWKDETYNDEQWGTMQIPGLWERQALGDFDGVVWLRKKFTLDGASSSADATLYVGMIDDADVTYVNGVKVGATTKYNEKRIYKIPKGVLKDGVNLVAVRVEDNGGGGGIFGNPSEVKITYGNQTQSLAGPWLYRVESILKSSAAIGPNNYPNLLFNAMISPLLNAKIKGVIWYQGEANASRAYQYRKAFPLLITDWRTQWGEGDFPFYFVQLASFNYRNGTSKKGSAFAELREAQTLALSLPNTGMAVTTDIGDGNNIHPKNKQDVGKRLAAQALHHTYGKNIVCSGPAFQSMKIEGNKALISFSDVGGGLLVKDPEGHVKGFEIAGTDHEFHDATAYIEGDHVVVFLEGISTPEAIHYGWADDAGECNLYNKEGFPAVPFRTDKWKGITEREKFRIEN